MVDIQVYYSAVYSALSISTKASIMAWRTINHLALHSLHNSALQFPLVILECLILSLSLNNWAHYGINWVKNLFLNGEHGTSKVLLTKYNIPRTTYFTLLHIKHFLLSSLLPTISLHPKVWHFLTNPLKLSKGILVLYNLLQNKCEFIH